ncbi:unnamed protein product [Kluyveromyces dobzhanskii CBS 2104]|uniref:2',3'-cyclic-nucleotide 3'-phosphodiesterase n=1 Tax=Kluyveromyces dobzhanskii CBS 2104 TaxID=1427455 RepID=A0A0A8LD70_9SACH|nr:unnamed protein product [Kluyveromyces dobzhanskii CBS 2104]
MGISLWLCPYRQSSEHETLKTLIGSLQTLFPNSPLFEPHVTVCSGLTCESIEEIHNVLEMAHHAINAVKSKINNENPLVEFDGFNIGKKYFEKCRLECKPNPMIYSLAKLIRSMFVGELNIDTWLFEEFHPHLSLAYSDIYPMDQAMIRLIRQRVEDLFDVATYEVKPHDRDQDAYKLQHTLSGWSFPLTFKVVRCEGPVEEWEVLSEVTVHG